MRRLLLIMAAFAVIALIVALRLYFKPHEDIGRQQADFRFTAGELAGLFNESAGDAEARLTGTVVELSGTPGSVKRLDAQFLLTFDEGGDYVVQAYVPEAGIDTASLTAGTPVSLKCRYAGHVINDEDFLIPADIKIEACVVLP